MVSWSINEAFKSYMDNLEGLEDDIQEWMDSRGSTREQAYKLIEDAEWELWDAVMELDGWLEDIAWNYNTDFDDLKAQSEKLMLEDIFGTIGFDEKSKMLVRL